jgi:hypothetical protein
MDCQAVSMPADGGVGRRTRAGIIALLVATACLCAVASIVWPARTLTASNPTDTLTYEPYGFVHSIRPASQVDGYLGDLDSHGIGQALLQMPKFKSKTGLLKMPGHNRTMLSLWASRAAAYNLAPGTHLVVTAVFNGKVRPRRTGLDLDDPATRANMIAGIESALETGISGVQLDLEPYPVSAGFI